MLYQDVIVSIHGVNVLIGFINRNLFCTSNDLVETLKSNASPYCTISGVLQYTHVYVTSVYTVHSSNV